MEEIGENISLKKTSTNKFTTSSSSPIPLPSPPPPFIPSIENLLNRLVQYYDPEFLERLLNVYQLGSRVYGTATEKSDWDFFVIVKYHKFIQGERYHWEMYDDGLVNAAIYDFFELMISEHRMEALECLFLSEEKKWLEKKKFELKLDLLVLRMMASWIASNRWCMAKSRIANEPYKGKKCIFHGIRYLIFAIQVAKHGKIVDYSAANNFLHEIMANPSYDWNVLERIYAPIYKDLRAELSSLIPNSEFYHKAETLLTIWKGLQSRKNKDKISPPQFSLPPSIQTLQSFISIPNNMNEFIHFLQQNGIQGLYKFANVLFLNICRGSEHQNLIHISLTVSSPLSIPFVRECNGLIIEENTWKPIVLSFPKILHYDEPSISLSFDWSSARIYEKIDATFVVLYWYSSKWYISTKWEADGQIPWCWKASNSKTQLCELFWKEWNNLGYKFPEDITKCYTFSFWTSQHRIITTYSKNRIILLSVRDCNTWQELDPIPFSKQYSWEMCPQVDLLNENSLKDTLISKLTFLNPFECPGYIVCDKDMNRLKMMGKQYIGAVHCMEFKNPSFGCFNLTADNLEARDIAELIRVKQIDIFLRHFPKWKSLAEGIQEKVNHFFQSISIEYEKLHQYETKTFAKEASKCSNNSILFALHHRQVCSIEEYFAIGVKSGAIQYFQELNLVTEKEK